MSSLQQRLNLPLRFSKYSLTHMTADSRKASSSGLFFALKGSNQDGHHFLSQACQQFAACIGESDFDAPNYFQVADSKHAYALAAAFFADDPSLKMKIIGVTGTSGKTTTTYLIESIFAQAGYHVGVIGTVSIRYAGKSFASSHTTPDALEFNLILKEMLSHGVQIVVCEISSHALDQKRVDGIAFDGMVFTNLSSEHLDYHSDLPSYFEAKALLFTHCAVFSRQKGKDPVAIINTICPWGKKMQERAKDFFPVVHTLDSFFSSWTQSEKGIQGHFHQVAIQSPLVGEFNQENLKAALTIGALWGVPLPSVLPQEVIPGRLEQVSPGVFVDYAHKPDALQKVLVALRGFCSGRLIVVFGCGGDRDRQKRPVMGKIAVDFADLVFVTSDNPRSEDPFVIIAQIVQGIESKVQVVEDRKQAIFQALREKQLQDCVLIAGKGHETYQLIKKEQFFFSDAAVVREFFEKTASNS
jgi:UDP-N-acetylmuramoyl-L-alanyl-D-glutamate--2,6-diaminopimelate ligase